MIGVPYVYDFVHVLHIIVKKKIRIYSELEIVQCKGIRSFYFTSFISNCLISL